MKYNLFAIFFCLVSLSISAQNMSINEHKLWVNKSIETDKNRLPLALGAGLSITGIKIEDNCVVFELTGESIVSLAFMNRDFMCEYILNNKMLWNHIVQSGYDYKVYLYKISKSEAIDTIQITNATLRNYYNEVSSGKFKRKNILELFKQTFEARKFTLPRQIGESQYIINEYIDKSTIVTIIMFPYEFTRQEFMLSMDPKVLDSEKGLQVEHWRMRLNDYQKDVKELNINVVIMYQNKNGDDLYRITISTQDLLDSPKIDRVNNYGEQTIKELMK